MKRSYYLLLAVVLVAGLSFPFSPAYAAQLTSMSDVLSNLNQGVVSNHTITFTTPTGVAAGQTITIIFPGTFASGLNGIAFGDLDMTDNGSEVTLAAAASTTTWGVGVSTRTITITSDTGTITAGHTVVIEIGLNATEGVAGDTQIVNPASAADSVPIGLTAGTADSGTLSITIENPDTVSVSGTVQPTIIFAISQTSVGFGDLSSTTGRWATAAGGGDASAASVPTAAHNLQITTNAANGWAITYLGTTLTSTAGPTITAATISPADSDGTPGTEQFALNASTNGAGDIASGYLRDTTPGNDSVWKFVPSTTTPQTLASDTVPTDIQTITVSYLANIAGSTESGTYSTTLTYIATATF